MCAAVFAARPFWPAVSSSDLTWRLGTSVVVIRDDRNATLPTRCHGHQTGPARSGGTSSELAIQGIFVTYHQFFFGDATVLLGPKPPHFFDFDTRTTLLGRPPLDEGSARRRDLYLTTQTPGGVRTSTPINRTAEVLLLRPRGRRHLHFQNIPKNSSLCPHSVLTYFM